MTTRGAILATAGALALTVAVGVTPQSEARASWQVHNLGWHRVNTPTADVLAESGLPRADRREWERCSLNFDESVVRCGRHSWSTGW